MQRYCFADLAAAFCVRQRKGIIRLPPRAGPYILVHSHRASCSAQNRTPYRSRRQMPRAMSVAQLWVWVKMSSSLRPQGSPKLVDLVHMRLLSLLVGTRSSAGQWGHRICLCHQGVS